MLGAVGFAVFLAEKLDIQAKVTCSRQVVRIGLHAANNLAADDAKREDVDALVIYLMFEHFGRHRKRVAHHGVALLALLMIVAASFKLALGSYYERVGRRRLRRLHHVGEQWRVQNQGVLQFEQGRRGVGRVAIFGVVQRVVVGVGISVASRVGTIAFV